MHTQPTVRTASPIGKVAVKSDELVHVLTVALSTIAVVELKFRHEIETVTAGSKLAPLTVALPVAVNEFGTTLDTTGVAFTVTVRPPCSKPTVESYTINKHRERSSANIVHLCSSA